MMIIDERTATFDPETRCLEIDLLGLCRTKLRFHPWDEGLSLERWEDGQWWPEREDPGISLLASALETDQEGPVRSFLASIPEEIKELARPFDHCQTIVLRMLWTSEHAKSLASSSPILLVLVADAVDRGRLTDLQARALLKERNTKILAALGGIETEESMGVIGRLRLSKLDQENLEMVRHAISDPYTIYMLRFHLEITTAGLRFAIEQSPPPLLSPQPPMTETVEGVDLTFYDVSHSEMKKAC